MFDEPKDKELKDELLRGDALEDIAMELKNTIPEINLRPHECNCPPEALIPTSSRKDMAHGEYVNEYRCGLCNGKLTNFHSIHPYGLDESYMA